MKKSRNKIYKNMNMNVKYVDVVKDLIKNQHYNIIKL